MSGPLVTAIIPTRNRAGFLGSALRSAFGQKDVELEVIVVDDASDDATGELLARADDPRLRCLRHERRQGVAAARNTGLGAARGCFAAFLDDDDLWAPDKLAAQLAQLALDAGAEWSCTGAVLVDAARRIRSLHAFKSTRRLVEASLLGNVVPGGGSGVLARTGLLVQAGGFDPSFSALADWDLWIRLARIAPLSVVPRPLVAYTIHEGAMSSHDVAIESEIDRVVAKHEALRKELGVADQPREIFKWLAKRRWNDAARGRALALLGRRQPLLLPSFLLRRLAAPAFAGLARVARAGGLGGRVARWRREAEAWLAPYRSGAPSIGPAR